LKKICELADKYEAIVVVDDCLGLGILGNNGRGSVEVENVLD
jgi:glycine C-acetyltransferase